LILPFNLSFCDPQNSHRHVFDLLLSFREKSLIPFVPSLALPFRCRFRLVPFVPNPDSPYILPRVWIYTTLANAPQACGDPSSPSSRFLGGWWMLGRFFPLTRLFYFTTEKDFFFFFFFLWANGSLRAGPLLSLSSVPCSVLF